MDILNGVVSKLKSAIEVSDGGRRSGVTFNYVAIFYLNGQPVRLKSSEAVFIDEGDNLSVAGDFRNGIFNSYAYVNNTTGVSGDIGIGLRCLVGIIFIIGGMFFLIQAPNFLHDTFDFLDIIPFLVSVTLIGLGSYTLYEGVQVSNASKLLHKHKRRNRQRIDHY